MMKILDKKVLAEGKPRIVYLEVLAEEICKTFKPGQFVILMVSEVGERIPLTIVDKNLKNQSISLIFQEVGLTTKLLGRLNKGDSLYSLVGPLGNPAEIKNYGKVILVGGGVGIAEIFPLARAFKEEGNHLTTILGARNKDLLILEEKLRKVSDEFYITTDDGSYGRKGFTTDVLKELLENSEGLSSEYRLIYAVGPIPMMKKVSELTQRFKIKTLVSLNALMVDGTGMCGCCRVSVGGEIKFSCVDGPEFEAHLINWTELSLRNKIYEDKEKHICKLYKLVT
ncbi:MAG: sulfide/dihydroorotate dehydrogenase-like FAD/NAD-binding protein [Candidatus Omnitrophota bacterium]|nr:MAG: sulfide/dihydroorotate dehydrogenase-like FAD/NAD-binding protein [Candidatus Omnitrophota bacterium]RKY44373.1 MAG: sulfide/dihydroorotate dehydrogenase-like FAD/NAD-binding protein [Candidatus Omnitrophota bacterium]